MNECINIRITRNVFQWWHLTRMHRAHVQGCVVVEGWLQLPVGPSPSHWSIRDGLSLTAGPPLRGHRLDRQRAWRDTEATCFGGWSPCRQTCAMPWPESLSRNKESSFRYCAHTHSLVFSILQTSLSPPCLFWTNHSYTTLQSTLPTDLCFLRTELMF